ncbi:MAG: DNA-binding protein [Planctomycetota bacterium]|nr:MAG: DNA-binding protein [Planctomycetota bacterium]
MDAIQAIPFGGCQEPVSSLSHLLGAFYFAWLGTELVRRGRGDRARTLSLAIMTICSVVLLLLSSAYHVAFPGALREFMLRADVSAVFLVIAGSMTPVHAILFRGKSRWLALTIIWTLAALGIVVRMIFHESLDGRTGVMLFLVFGWGGAITFSMLWRRFGWQFVKPAFLSGMAYTSGALMLFFHSPTLVQGVIGPHELWHFTVLAGLGLHWNFVFQFASGKVAVNYQPVPAHQQERGMEPGDLQTT